MGDCWPGVAQNKEKDWGELELKLGLREKILGFIRLRGTGSIKITCPGWGGGSLPSVAGEHGVLGEYLGPGRACGLY